MIETNALIVILLIAFCVLVIITLNKKGNSSKLNKTNSTIKAYNTINNKEISSEIDRMTGFIGIKYYSPDQSLCVSCNSGYFTKDNWINGKIAVLNDKKLFFKKELERPNDCAISNNGKLACCDWLNSNDLSGKFYVFNQSGKEIYSLKTKANLGSCSISKNGEIAIVETHYSDSKDGNKLFVINTESSSIINALERPIPFISSRIDIDKKTIDLINKNEVVYKIDFNGNHINFKDFKIQLFQKSNTNEILLYYLKQPVEIKYQDKDYLNLLLKASKDKDCYISLRSDKVFREIGEFYENLGDLKKTIQYWEKAIEINPKVGIKRKLNDYKKNASYRNP
ncbi:hypothetical protein [Leeuwenhoekiella palythoae]|uniref:hypothetical protein n=1 Tax=Leeuwenhoekiella palythoae TaxID=573501 RepID=UPI003515475C